MNLKTYQQSELKRLKLEVEEILRNRILDITDEYRGRNQKERGGVQVYFGYPQQLIDELNSSIEKAYALGKAEREKEILSELPKENTFELRKDNPQYSLGQTSGYFLAIEDVKNLLKNK